MPRLHNQSGRHPPTMRRRQRPRPGGPTVRSHRRNTSGDSFAGGIFLSVQGAATGSPAHVKQSSSRRISSPARRGGGLPATAAATTTSISSNQSVHVEPRTANPTVRPSTASPTKQKSPAPRLRRGASHSSVLLSLASVPQHGSARSLSARESGNHLMRQASGGLSPTSSSPGEEPERYKSLPGRAGLSKSRRVGGGVGNMAAATMSPRRAGYAGSSSDAGDIVGQRGGSPSIASQGFNDDAVAIAPIPAKVGRSGARASTCVRRRCATSHNQPCFAAPMEGPCGGADCVPSPLRRQRWQRHQWAHSERRQCVGRRKC